MIIGRCHSKGPLHQDETPDNRWRTWSIDRTLGEGGNIYRSGNNNHFSKGLTLSQEAMVNILLFPRHQLSPSSILPSLSILTFHTNLM